MRRSKAEVERYIASVQGAAPSPREKSMKGFFFAKLYYEAKEYELAKRYISSYLDVQERDPKALKFLGHLYEVDGLVDKAVACYKSSVELNPTQKDLVLKIAELLCDKNIDDGRADYWVEKAAKLFPGSPAVYKLKEKLLNFKGDVGWNQLFDLIQSELYTRPDDVYVNIRLVELYRANKRLEEAVNHCLNAQKKGSLRTSLDWCSCVVRILKEYLKSLQGLEPDKSTWRTLNQQLLLAHCNLMLLTLSTKDVQDCRKAFQSFDQVLQSVKPHASGSDDLSVTFLEIRGHFYMHAGTLLLKMAQHSEAQWRAVTEPAALCYLIAFQVPKPKNKSIKVAENGPDLLEMLACDRRSQTGHMLYNLSHNKEDFLKGVVETFANKSGRSALFEVLFEKQTSMEQSFLGCDDIRDVERREPELAELARCDNSSIHFHNGNLHHLTWLGLQWHNKLSSPPAIRKWLKQLFPRLPQETTRLDTNAPDSICILDLEVFLLAVIFASHLQLQDHFNTHYNSHQPRCLPLAICTPLGTERQRSWWDAVYNLIHKKTQPGASAKLRLLFQHELITLRALEKHGLQPAVIIHWARNLHKTGSALNSYYDQKDYMIRCVHYWKKVLPLLESIKRKKSIPEPIDPLFKHFHSQDIQVSEVADYEEEAQIAFASLDVVDGKFDDAIRTFDEIKNVVSYWNLARIYQRKAEDIENDAISPEEQEECTNCLQKSRGYLSKIIEESFADATVAEKLPVSLESVKKMLDSVLQELGEYCEEDAPVFNESSRIDAEIKHSTPSPTKFSISPNKSYKLSPKTPPRWVEDQKALLQMLCHQVEALKNEVQELKLNASSNASPHRWPSESFGPEPVPDGYRGPQSYHGTPLTVSTSGSSGYYNQSPSYNSKYLLRTATNDTPAKAPVYGMNRLVPQQQMYAYQQQIQTPPLQSASSCKFPRETFSNPMHYESPAPGLLSPRGDEFYNYSVAKNPANPPLPEPGYFTKPTVAPPSLDSKIEEYGKSHFGQAIQTDAITISPFIKPSQATPSAFKFTSNFQSNDGDFTFSTPQFVSPSTGFTGSECLFSLLTSDKPFQDCHTVQKEAVPSQTTDQRNHFNFGSKSLSGNSFAENAAQFQDKTTSVFDKDANPFSFQDPRMPVPNPDPANISHDSDRGSILGADEDGPHFEPVVPLPDKVEVKTGEEDEEELFSNRAKLFRFDAELKEWKERGVGIVKILRHTKSGKMRLLMRREQVLKICANHYINPDMTLKPNAGSDKSYVWHAVDYADEKPKPEQLAIRFKTPEEASLFKRKFEEAQKLLRELTSVGTPSLQSVKTFHEAKSGDKASDKSFAASANFGFQFNKKAGEWECDVCLVRNAVTASVCAACQTAKIDSAVSSSVPAVPTFSFGKSAADATCGGGFGGQFTKKQGEWDCDGCLVRNAATALVCVACQTACPNVSGKVIAPIAVPHLSVATTTSVNSPPPFSFSKEKTVSAVPGFGEHLKKKKGQWECKVCLVTNEASAKMCLACRTPATTGSVTGTVPQASSNKIGPSEISSSVKTDFGARFSRKEGEWDCNVCLVRNEATSVSCVSCLTPNPQVTPASTWAGIPASGFKFSSTTSTSTSKPSGFGTQFSKKEGQWDCNVCLVRNESSLANCASCQTPNQCVKPAASAIPASSAFTFGLTSKLSEPTCGKLGTESKSVFSEGGFKFGHTEQVKTTSVPVTGFGEHLKKKKGQWDCSACLVTNEATAQMCVACRTPAATSSVLGSGQQASSNKTGPTSIPISGKTDIGARFSRKEDQWDCNVCLVRNEVTSASCVACLTPNPRSATPAALPVHPASGFKFGSNTATVTSQPTGFGAQFSKKEGQWDCCVCLIRNESSFTNCASCQTPNPCAKPFPSTTPASSAFTFGLKSKLSEPAGGKLEAEPKGVFSESGFKFGHTEQDKTSSSTFQMPSFNPKSNPGKGGFNFAIPVSSGGFKFGTQDPNKNDQQKELAKEKTATFQKDSGNEEKVKPLENATVVSRDESIKRNDCVFGQNSNTFSFAKAAESGFGKNELHFKGISPTSKTLNSLTVEGTHASAEQERGDELYQTEDCDDIHFEPVVQLPEKVELVTGEEEEKVLYSQRVKLFRFDADTSQWKERGVGNMKILRNELTGALRLLMRRDQVLKVCANHWITNTVNLKPLSGSDRAWMWLANDFSDGDAKLEQLAAKFKTPDQAQDFKYTFEESQKLLSDLPPQAPGKVFESDDSVQVNVAERKVTDCNDFTEQSTKLHEESKNSDSMSHTGLLRDSITGPSIEFENPNLQTKILGDNLGSAGYNSPSASTPVKKNLFSFGESAAGFNFNFQPVSPSKSPTKLNQSRVSVGTDEESDVTQEEERDGQYFEPVVPLPDLVEISSGEENEQVLFGHRAKLYRFDKDANQWKERGIGDIKILQNYDTKSVRIIMRRDQVFKICANHRITPDINLKPMAGTERAWVWTAHDFSEGEGKIELFAVRFKLQDVAESFQKVFDEAKHAQERDILLTPASPRVSTPKVPTCGKMAVAVLEETTRERTDQVRGEDIPVASAVKSETSISSETLSKTVVSPPKFVFGSDSVKNIFSTEKPKSFTFGSTSTAGSMFGFSFDPLKSKGEKKTTETQNVTVKRLNFSNCSESQERSVISQIPENLNPLSSIQKGSSETETLNIPLKDENGKGSGAQSSSEDVFIVYELSPTPEQKALAESLQLPSTFFCYKNVPGYLSDDDQDDEDFETAVKKLNGRLYPDGQISCASLKDHLKGDIARANRTACISTEVKAETFKFLPTSLCDITNKDTDRHEVFGNVAVIKKSQNKEVTNAADTVSPVKLIEDAKSAITIKEEPDSTTDSTQPSSGATCTPVDLSTKDHHSKPGFTSKGLENFDMYGFSSSTGQSFADLASNNSGDFAFGSTDKSFTWQNSGAVVFASRAASRKGDGDHEDDSGDDAADNDDIHFEPIVSLPEVQVKSGEEDEEILFKERTKMYRFDRESGQWKERGVGEIKILYHAEKKYFRVLMRRDQVLKVCANHVISKSMDIQPLSTSNNALVWTATDYSDGEGRVEQVAVRFKTQDMADSFKMKFEECQKLLS